MPRRNFILQKPQIEILTEIKKTDGTPYSETIRRAVDKHGSDWRAKKQKEEKHT